MYKERWAHEGFAEYVQKLYSSEYLPLLNQLIEDLPDIIKNIEKATNANHIRWADWYMVQAIQNLKVFLGMKDATAAGWYLKIHFGSHR